MDGCMDGWMDRMEGLFETETIRVTFVNQILSIFFNILTYIRSSVNV
jgi:hypothetical protein